MTMMIALIGEQPLPNFLPVRYYQPEDVLLIYTTKTRQKYEYLKVALQKQVHVHGLEVDPYNIAEIVNAINSSLDEVLISSSQALLFNVTGGTKTMSLAAYQVALQRNAPIIYLQSEGKQTQVYHYEWENKQLKASGSELLPELLTLQDVFSLHFGQKNRNWQELGFGREGNTAIDGAIFERAIADVLRSNGYDTLVGVRAMNGQIDVDVAIRFGNQYGMIEAKVGDSGTGLNGIKQLSVAARHLGTYSQTFYVITVEPVQNQKMLADASNIQVISLPTYERGSRVLPQEEATKLLTEVGKKLKG